MTSAVRWSPRLERYLDALGTIASVSPLLGLLGTVFGMIDIFTVIIEARIGNPSILAGGMSEALLTTAAGLTVAIPSLHVPSLLQRSRQPVRPRHGEEALNLVEVIKGEREALPEAVA